MCGRFTLSTSPQALKDSFPLFDFSLHQPRYNIAPTQGVLAFRQLADAAGPECLRLRWGLVPHWALDAKIGYRMINARAETVASKPAFRSSFKGRRCLVLADGYYEWHKLDQGKQPYYICRRDRKPFAFAGLWDHWEKAQSPIDSCTIITTAANDLTKPIHDRMPVIVDEKDYAPWLDPGLNSAERLQPLLVPFHDDVLSAFPVGTGVNNPRNDVPECVQPL